LSCEISVMSLTLWQTYLFFGAFRSLLRDNDNSLVLQHWHREDHDSTPK